MRLAEKVERGKTKKLDEEVLRMLRHRHNPAVPRGPKWLPQVAQDITSLGSGSNLTLATGIGGIISRQTRHLLSKAYFLSVALLLTVLVGISRIYLGGHFPSDVLAGWAVGSLWSTICTQTARWLQRGGTVEAPKSEHSDYSV